MVVTDVITPTEYIGVTVLGLGILMMAQGVFAQGENRRLLPFALGSAVATASYTLIDGQGARVAGDAIGFVAWLFVADGLSFAIGMLAFKGPDILPRQFRPWSTGVLAAAASYGAYAISVWAMTVAPIALVAALRETSILFAVLLLVVTEPFLLQAAPLSEFQLRRPVIVIASALATSAPQLPTTMETTNLVSIAVFAVLQVAVYLLCLMKIREVAQQNVPPLVKLRLMENEENLFDLGLYVGIGGTAAAMVLITLGFAKANLLAAFSSNLFGITCVALVKIRHVRPYKRQLILEGQAAASRNPAAP